MEEIQALGTERISKLLFKFSIPCVLGLLIGAFYNIVDQIFIGNSELGYLGNAATGVSFPILCIANAFAWCIGDGAAAFLSICAGRGDSDRAHKCVGTCITVTALIGVVLGGQPIFGYNYGAGNYKRVRQAFKQVLAVSLIVGCVAVAIFELCPQIIINLFGEGGELYHEFAVKTFRIYLSLTMITGLTKVSSIFFQAIGKPVRAMLASLIRDVVCFTPLALLLPALLERQAPGSGIMGVLYAAPISDVVALVVILALTIPFFRRLGQKRT